MKLLLQLLTTIQTNAKIKVRKKAKEKKVIFSGRKEKMKKKNRRTAENRLVVERERERE